MVIDRKLEFARKIQREWGLDLIPGHVVVLDKDSRFVSCNLKFENNTHFKLEDVLGGLWFRLFHYAQVANFLNSLKKSCIESKEFSIRLQLQNKDLDFQWWQFEAIPRVSDGEQFYLLVGQDITGSYDDSRMLNWSQRQAKMGSFVYDLRSNLTNWSIEACRILSLPEDSKASLFDIVKNVQRKDQRNFENQLNGLLTGRDSTKFRYPFWNEAEQCLFWVQWIVESMYYGDQIVGFEGSLQDVSDEVLSFEAQLHYEKLSTVGEATAQIIHDVMNPMSIISGNIERIELLNETEEPKKDMYIKSATQMKKAVDRIYGIFDDIRDLLKTDIEFETVDLNSILEEAIFFIRDRAEKMEVEMICDIDKDFYLEAHKGQLIQVFVNLMKNSLDAISNIESKWIDIKCSDEGEFFLVSFKDSGNGIPKKVAEKIFISLFTTKQSEGGTGLGLSLCKKIIENHGGDLTINASSKNTEFLIKIPKHQANEAAA